MSDPQRPEPILPRIDGPQDLHALGDAELTQLAQEVREHIIDTVGEIGGTRRPTRSSGTSATRHTRTRSSRAAATSSRRSASTEG